MPNLMLARNDGLRLVLMSLAFLHEDNISLCASMARDIFIWICWLCCYEIMLSQDTAARIQPATPIIPSSLGPTVGRQAAVRLPSLGGDILVPRPTMSASRRSEVEEKLSEMSELRKDTMELLGRPRLLRIRPRFTPRQYVGSVTQQRSHDRVVHGTNIRPLQVQTGVVGEKLLTSRNLNARFPRIGVRRRVIIPNRIPLRHPHGLSPAQIAQLLNQLRRNVRIEATTEAPMGHITKDEQTRGLNGIMSWIEHIAEMNKIPTMLYGRSRIQVPAALIHLDHAIPKTNGNISRSKAIETHTLHTKLSLQQQQGNVIKRQKLQLQLQNQNGPGKIIIHHAHKVSPEPKQLPQVTTAPRLRLRHPQRRLQKSLNRHNPRRNRLQRAPRRKQNATRISPIKRKEQKPQELQQTSSLIFEKQQKNLQQLNVKESGEHNSQQQQQQFVKDTPPEQLRYQRYAQHSTVEQSPLRKKRQQQLPKQTQQQPQQQLRFGSHVENKNSEQIPVYQKSRNRRLRQPQPSRSQTKTTEQFAELTPKRQTLRRQYSQNYSQQKQRQFSQQTQQPQQMPIMQQREHPQQFTEMQYSEIISLGQNRRNSYQPNVEKKQGFLNEPYPESKFVDQQQRHQQQNQFSRSSLNQLQRQSSQQTPLMQQQQQRLEGFQHSEQTPMAKNYMLQPTSIRQEFVEQTYVSQKQPEYSQRSPVERYFTGDKYYEELPVRQNQQERRHYSQSGSSEYHQPQQPQYRPSRREQYYQNKPSRQKQQYYTEPKPAERYEQRRDFQQEFRGNVFPVSTPVYMENRPQHSQQLFIHKQRHPQFAVEQHSKQRPLRQQQQYSNQEFGQNQYLEPVPQKRYQQQQDQFAQSKFTGNKVKHYQHLQQPRRRQYEQQRQRTPLKVFQWEQQQQYSQESYMGNQRTIGNSNEQWQNQNRKMENIKLVRLQQHPNSQPPNTTSTETPQYLVQPLKEIIRLQMRTLKLIEERLGSPNNNTTSNKTLQQHAINKDNHKLSQPIVHKNSTVVHSSGNRRPQFTMSVWHQIAKLKATLDKPAYVKIGRKTFLVMPSKPRDA